MPTYVAGIVNHRSYEDLVGCITSLENQVLPPQWIAVVDGEPEEEKAAEIRRRFPRVRWLSGPNRGFGAGANRVLNALRDEATLPAAALILNPDVELEPHFAERILAEMEARPRVAIASGKLLRPGGTHIDSAGIVLPRYRRPHDRGSLQQDRGQFDRVEPVFGVCGAAIMIRRTALPALSVHGEVFDESFFVYREDTDLCWRANLLGLEVLYVPTARAIHGRRWRHESPRSRRSIAVSVRCHSFKNHYLQLVKNEQLSTLLKNLPFILGFEALRLGYALLVDRAILSGYRAAWELWDQTLEKRRVIFSRLPRATEPVAESYPLVEAAPAVERVLRAG